MSKFTFFGGKGGVGKTTVSAAFGVRCANAGDETLLVSTDPAHSTSDVFGQSFGDTPTQVEGYEGLSAMEIDPDAEVDAHLQGDPQADGRAGAHRWSSTRSTARSRWPTTRQARTRPRCSTASST